MYGGKEKHTGRGERDMREESYLRGTQHQGNVGEERRQRDEGMSQ